MPLNTDFLPQNYVIKCSLSLGIYFTFLGSDDWLQEEYEKIKKNQTLITLQSQLDKIKKRVEKFNEMTLRVAKTKTNKTASKTEFYFQNADKKVELENKENIQEQSEEDTDLILDNFEENTQSDEEGDVEVAEDRDDFLKVNV